MRGLFKKYPIFIPENFSTPWVSILDFLFGNNAETLFASTQNDLHNGLNKIFLVLNAKGESSLWGTTFRIPCTSWYFPSRGLKFSWLRQKFAYIPRYETTTSVYNVMLFSLNIVFSHTLFITEFPLKYFLLIHIKSWNVPKDRL